MECDTIEADTLQYYTPVYHRTRHSTLHYRSSTATFFSFLWGGRRWFTGWAGKSPNAKHLGDFPAKPGPTQWRARFFSDPSFLRFCRKSGRVHFMFFWLNSATISKIFFRDRPCPIDMKFSRTFWFKLLPCFGAPLGACRSALGTHFSPFFCWTVLLFWRLVFPICLCPIAVQSALVSLTRNLAFFRCAP